MPFTLEILENTLAKLRPRQASELRLGETQPLAKGTALELQSYAYADEGGKFNGHVKFAIANPEDWLQNLNTWYVYEGHARVLEDGQVVYPPAAPPDEPDTQFLLRITRDTYFKRAPQQSVSLEPDQLYRVSKGSTFELQSYGYGTPERDFNGHIKFTLKDRDIEGFNTWYVYEGHAEVLANGKVVYPQVEHEHPQVLKVLQNTYFKREPEQSVSLPREALYRVEAGSEYDILAYAYADAGGSFNGHVKFTLKDREIRGFNTWFIYERDAEIYYDGELVYPLPTPSTPPEPVERGPSIRLPGYRSSFYLRDSIIPGGSFTWGEATKNGSRIPSNKEIVNNILGLAKRLETARDQIGRPFVVNSWYRDPVTNRMVGGALYSRHLYGQAIDFYVPGVPAPQVAAALSWWPGGLGTYPNWVHLDTGPRRRWQR